MRLAVALVAAVAAAVAVGAAAPHAGAGTKSSIVFQAPGPGEGTSVEFGAGSSDNQVDSISLGLQQARAPLPKRFSIQIPTGYQLDLGAKPGDEVAIGLLSILGVGSPSVAAGFGSFVAVDPNASASSPADQACAPGLHAAVWSASISIAGQPVTLTLFVDAGGPAGVAYTVQSCPTGLATGSTDSIASIQIAGLPLTPPTAPGSYLWHTYVTPQEGAMYELQALLPFPESATLKAAYDPKAKAAVLTGKVIEAGALVAGASVEVNATYAGQDSESDTYSAKTGADGSYRVRTRVAKSTDFAVGVDSAGEPCIGQSSAPGGCLARVTVPPGGDFATLYVSVKGGAVRSSRPADRRLADRESLKAPDFPAGFAGFDPGIDGCWNPSHEADLKITGESVSPVFAPGGFGTPLPQTGAISRVYATKGQALAAFTREAITASMRCEMKQITGGTARKITTVGIRGLAAQMRGFRIRLPGPQGTKYDADLLYLHRGRSVTSMLFVAFAGSSVSLENTLAAKISARLR